MVDDTNNPYSRAENATNVADAQPVAFCQECGRPLVTADLHRVRNGVFCSYCAVQQTAQGWSPVQRTAQPGAGVLTASGGRGGPSPAVAAALGFIPGVGAMYNGQYAKGALHLIVFVVLVSIADHLNGVLYWLVWGWVFYQAFDAYHTAVARRDGAPLPNPFGWNDVGDRFGFGRNAAPPPITYSAPASQGVPPVQNQRREYEIPERPVQDGSWATFQPSERRSSENPYADAFQGPAQTSGTPSPAYMTGVPFTPTFTGVAAVPESAHLAAANQRRFPVGAVWLIGLGVVFLSGNLLPALRLSSRWLVPAVLTGVALWMAAKRWDQYRVAAELSQAAPTSLVASMTGPCLLLVVAFLLSLDAGDVLSMHRSWPLLLVVWGAILLTKRAALEGVSHAGPERFPTGPAEMVARTAEETPYVRSVQL